MKDSKPEQKEEEKELTESQKKFCREWIWDFNGTRAYQAAYPESSYDAARSSAADLLAKPNIKAHCKYLQDNLSETTGISREKVLREHEKLAFSSIAHLHNTWITRKEFEELTDDQKACISEISTQTRTEIKNRGEKDEEAIEVDFVKIKLYDKQKSLDAINKMLGFDAPTKVDHTTGGERINQMPEIKVYNTAPPLASSEGEIDIPNKVPVSHPLETGKTE